MSQSHLSSAQASAFVPARRIAHLRGDITGGIAGAIASLALALSVGLLGFAPLGPSHANIGVLAGFAAAIYGQLVAAALGGTTHPGSGPRAATALILAAVVANLVTDPAFAPLTTGNVARIVALAGAVVAFAGLLQIVLGAVGAGVFARYVPYPFVAGFMVGAAALIIVSQLPPITGVTRIDLVQGPGAIVTAFQPLTFMVGATTIAVMWLATKRKLLLPGALAGLMAGTLLFYFFDALFGAAELGPVLGRIAAQFPSPAAMSPLFDMPWEVVSPHLGTMLSTGIIIAVIGSLDTLFAAVAVDHVTDGRHDVRRELVAHGFANIASGLCGGVPVVLAPSRVLASWHAGGRTRTSGIIAALILALLLALAGPMLALIPLAVVAGVMVLLGWGLIDNWTHGMVRRLRTSSMRGDPPLFWSAITVALVALAAIFVGFVAAIIVGFVLSGLLFVIGMNRSLVRSVVDANVRPSRRVWGGEDAARVREVRSRIQVLELQGSLFFGSAERLMERVEPMAGAMDAVVLDFRRVTTIDATGAVLVERLARRLSRRGTKLLLAGVTRKGRHGSTFSAHGTFHEGSLRLWFRDADQAVEWAEDHGLARGGRLEQKELTLGAFTIVADLQPDDLDYIGQHLARRTFAAQEVLFRENDPGDRLYLIARGAVEISINAGMHRVRIVTMAAGSLFGEAALLDGRPRSATAQAVEETVVWELTREALDEIGRERPHVAMLLMRNLARVLAARMRDTNEILRQLEELPG
ncbi:MAG TPA: SulP family inorganic anion transporter [Burkholderiales bacterium]|nr:SulP family inorganic anion transporter [Burkholderiales bacterium]